MKAIVMRTVGVPGTGHHHRKRRRGTHWVRTVGLTLATIAVGSLLIAFIVFLVSCLF
jgi:hypothetical protein